MMVKTILRAMGLLAALLGGMVAALAAYGPSRLHEYTRTAWAGSGPAPAGDRVGVASTLIFAGLLTAMVITSLVLGSVARRRVSR